MKTNFKILILFITVSFYYRSQQFGHFASATYIQTCTNEKFYNNAVERADPDCINPDCDTIFDSKNFGAFFKNSNDLILRGGELKTFRGVNSNVCGAKLYYTIYTVGNRPANPVFLEINLPHASNCDLGDFTFQDNFGPCIDRDQKWGTQAQHIDLTTFNQGNYALEVYFEAFGSHNTTNQCDDTMQVINGGNNFIALFQIIDATITANGPTSFCEGGQVTLTSSVPLGNIWNTGETTQSITVNASGTYGLNLPALNSCQTSDQTSITVTVNPLPNVSAGNDIAICAGQSVTLNGTGATTYTWDNGVQNGVAFTPTQTQTYTVIGTNTITNCSNSATINVTINSFSTVDVSSNSTIVSPGQLVTFQNNSENATSFSWNFNNGQNPLIVSDLSSQQTAFQNPGNYFIVLTSNNLGCLNSDSVLIIVKVLDTVTIETPNIFTPNGDPANNGFTLNTTNAKEIKITILNRWGNIVFEINDFTTTWDGKIDGKLATEGTYFYIYEVKDVNDQIHKGHNFLTLVR